MATRPFGILVYGATGFTGGLVAEYLAARSGALRFAIAGRNQAKLDAVAERLYSINPKLRGSLGVLVDTGGLPAVVRQAAVAITTVGPFTLHGEPLLRACIEEGTHYIDSTGEFPWVKAMDAKYGAAARAKGVLVVPMSGFDSVPSDLAAFLVVHRARSELGAGVGVRAVRTYVAVKGAASGGTIASTFEVVRRARPEDSGPLALAPAGMAAAAARRIVDVGAPSGALPGWSSEMRRWQHVFFMAAVNTAVVRRSALILADRGAAIDARGAEVDGALPGGSSGAGYSPGAPFAYTEAMTSSSLLRALVVTAGTFFAGLFFVVCRFLPASTVAVIQRALFPAPGTGPSAEVRAASFFTMEAVAQTDGAGARGTGPRTVRVRVGGGDPGYSETAKMLSESALCILEGAPSASASGSPRILPGVALGGGFLTPATAFGTVLQRRLQRAGMRFSWALTESPEPPPASAWREYEA